MGKVTIHGWVTDPEEIAKANAAVPLGPMTLRDGRKVMCLTEGSLRKALSCGATDDEQNAFAKAHPGELVITLGLPKRKRRPVG